MNKRIPNNFNDSQLAQTGWENMNALLDKELPTEKNNRKVIFWWWFGASCLVASAVFGFTVLSYKNTNTIGNDNSTPQNYIETKAAEQRPKYDAIPVNTAKPNTTTGSSYSHSTIKSISKTNRQIQNIPFNAKPISIDGTGFYLPISAYTRVLNTDSTSFATPYIAPINPETTDTARLSNRLAYLSPISLKMLTDVPRPTVLDTRCIVPKAKKASRFSPFVEVGSKYNKIFGFKQAYTQIGVFYDISRRWAVGIRAGYDFATMQSISALGSSYDIAGSPSIIADTNIANYINVSNISSADIAATDIKTVPLYHHALSLEAIGQIHWRNRLMLELSSGYKRAFFGSNVGVLTKSEDINSLVPFAVMPLERNYNVFTSAFQLNYRFYKKMYLTVGSRYDCNMQSLPSNISFNAGVRFGF